MKTRITELLGIEHPIFQAAMSWASSSSALVIAVSNAGGMGVLAAGTGARAPRLPMKSGTDHVFLYPIDRKRGLSLI